MDMAGDGIIITETIGTDTITTTTLTTMESVERAMKCMDNSVIQSVVVIPHRQRATQISILRAERQ